MVCFTSIFTRFLRPRKSRRSLDLSPPPYDPQNINVVQVEEKQHVTTETQLLNPELHFTAQEIEAQLVIKDTRFAAAVVELMVPRLKLGVWKEPVGWGHYSYTLDKKKDTGCHSDACQCNKATGWDNIIGFKAWDYSSRFQQVGNLVKRDLELRGFAVDKVEVYTHKCTLKDCRGGVFVKWDINFPAEKNVDEINKQLE